MSVPWIACALGLLLGVIMGLVMLLRPRQSHLSIGLGSIPEKSGGVGESRAFGGMLLGIHALPLFLVLLVIEELLHPPAPTALINPAREVVLPEAPYWEAGLFVWLLAVGWLCAFLGRLLSVIIDREGLAMNFRLLGLDALMTLLIGAPAVWPLI